MLNNATNAVVVYGSHAPGCKNHGPFSKLPGTWLPGKIKVNLINPPDDIGPGEVVDLPAYFLEFSDTEWILYGKPGHHEQAVLLHNRWNGLDKLVGPDFVRGSTRWWPDGVDSVVNADMRVTNVYLPRKNWPHLANQARPPHPDKREDINGLWFEVVDDGIRYEADIFIALIKDAHPDQYEAMFGALPHGGAFIKRLRDVFHDLALSPSSMLWDGTSDRFSLYAHPTTRHAVAPEILLDMAKAALTAKAALLPLEEAQRLASIPFRLGTKEDADAGEDTETIELYEDAEDILLGQLRPKGPWAQPLREACYGIAASYEVVEYLMSTLSPSNYDPLPDYVFWRAGGRLAIIGDACVVWSVDLRASDYAPPEPPLAAALPPTQDETPAKGWRKWFSGRR